MVHSQKGVIQPLLYTSLLQTLPTLPTLPTQPKKTLALKAVEFPRVKSLKKVYWSTFEVSRRFTGSFLQARFSCSGFFASNVICINLSVNNLRCFYEQSERSLIVHSGCTIQKITLCYFDVTNSYPKNLFSPALIYIFPRVSSWAEQSSLKLVSHLKDIMEDSFANQNISTK